MSIAPTSPLPTWCDLVSRSDTGLAASDVAPLEALLEALLDAGALEAGGAEAEVLTLAGADELTALEDAADAALCELLPHAATRTASATKAVARSDVSTGLLYVGDRP
jgi:hypothetical protein